MATPVNKEWAFTTLMNGSPKDTDFTTREIAYPTITDGEYIIKSEHFSVDPYLRGFLTASFLDSAVPLYVVGTIVESKNGQMKVGDVVTGILPCQLYISSSDVTIRKIDTVAAAGIPLYQFVGVLGMPGATAYNMSKKIKKGDVIFCGASCGIVGSLMGPLAKQAGATIIGCAGGQEKCERAKTEFGYDVCIDYKKYQSLATDEEKIAAVQSDLKVIFADLKVDGISLFYDLIGGYMSDAMWSLMTYGCRAVIVGAIDEYNQETQTKCPRFLSNILYKAGTIYTQFVFDHFGPNFKDFDAEFEGAFIPKINAKELPTNVTIIDDFQMTKAFQGLFTGANVGKMIINP